jgi:hypothetical protein
MSEVREGVPSTSWREQLVVPRLSYEYYWSVDLSVFFEIKESLSPGSWNALLQVKVLITLGINLCFPKALNSILLRTECDLKHHLI